MKIESATLQLIELPLKFRFETSFGVQTRRTILVLTLRGEGLEGYGESVMEMLPQYREETTPGAEYLLKEVLLPRVLGKTFNNPQELGLVLAPFKGNRMAKAVLEMAFWDLWARSLQVSLSHLIGGVRKEVTVGVSLGIQPTVDDTVRSVEKHVMQGYRRIKLKIKPGWDLNIVKDVRAEFPDITLTVDANSAYTMADVRTFQKMDAYQLDYIEQPLAHEDLHDHAKLQKLIQTPLCLDESILSSEDTRKALETHAGRVINLKPARVGGVSESLKIHTVAQSFGVPLWMGGMLEAGVGRAFNIHISSLPGFTKPGDTSSSSRYWETDIINEPLEAVDGLMPVPVGPGIGVTLNQDFLKTITLRQHEVKA
ncbi:o-succinylbenzoate synthase [Deinococcus roseus]|uniref:o-succinylbenzoate synthase n=1 Tax=Deinococcus roseus TaxID=392414 RepID=A0ABQ2DFN9_9DEIO|nr:o-succinylbenzoate synthase [Deinococcus roseus]GGJ54176.1 o-succinylbenzoate synthase [Deinococcus roseus]